MRACRSLHEDRARIVSRLITAGKHLSVAGTGVNLDALALAQAVRLVEEVGDELEWLRRLAELQELFVEVTALVEAQVDPAEVESKLARARQMADDLAAKMVSGEHAQDEEEASSSRSGRSTRVRR